MRSVLIASSVIALATSVASAQSLPATINLPSGEVVTLPADLGLTAAAGPAGSSAMAPANGATGSDGSGAANSSGAQPDAGGGSGAADAALQSDPDSMALQSEAAALVDADPEMSAMLAAVTTTIVQPALTWNESATRDFYNANIGLAWQHTLGDYDPTLLASVSVPDTDTRFTVNIPVTGNDFYILNGGGGSAVFDSRSGPSAYRPTLIVNGLTHYIATRDVALSSALSGSLGTATTLNDRQAMLIAFDSYKPRAGDSAILQLTAEREYSAHILSVYRPAIVPQFPTIDATSDATVVADFPAAAFGAGTTYTVANGIVRGQWGGQNATAISKLFPLAPANEYYLTVVMKLENDWPNQAGKLPGLGNTGQATNFGGTPLTINGVNCNNSGWGGRTATGCRWSARTGWGGRSGNSVGLHTYYYAQNPSSAWGVIQNWPTPVTVGQWFAYVERVKVNTPGQGDGRLSYWLCTAQACNPQFDRNDITWSSYDIPEAKITEAWADVYCGGTGCPPPGPWKTSTADLKRMTVTTGLPDLNALQAEVQAMNASGL